MSVKVTRNKPVRWADMCRSWRMMGIMKDFSKLECLRMAKVLDGKVRRGEVIRIRRGLYKMPDSLPDYPVDA